MNGGARLRIGIVGFGKIAEDQHAPVIRSHPAFELAAIVSGHGATGPDLPRSFPTLAEMLAGVPDLDAVAICTPPGPRPGLAREALRAGRHVLLEKPPAATLGEAEDLADVGRAAGRTLFATWHSRFAPAVERAREELATETIRRLRVTWREDVRRWHPGQAWIWEPGGFGVFDPGTNALSIVTRILPRAVFVRSARLEVPANRDTPIAAEIAFGQAEDGEADLAAEFDWRQTGPQSWDIAVGTGSGRDLLLSGGGRRLEIDGRVVADGEPAEYRGIYDRFAELIRTGASDVDVSPLRLVADAFLLGRRVETEPFRD